MSPEAHTHHPHHVNWSNLFAGVAAMAALVVCIVMLLTWHEARPHSGTVTRDEYAEDIKQIRSDIREIRQIVSRPHTD